MFSETKDNTNKYINSIMMEKKKILDISREIFRIYFEKGARSSAKVDYFHQQIKGMIDTVINKRNLSNGYNVKLEKNVPSINSSGRKKCDIVVYKENNPYIVLPVKIIMTNYKQNKNNYWESLTGELTHMKWHADNNIRCIPINLFFNKLPYLAKSGEIKKWEEIKTNDIQNYKYLVSNNLAYGVVNHIIEVNHINKIGEKFEKTPELVGFLHDNPYISIVKLMEELIK